MKNKLIYLLLACTVFMMFIHVFIDDTGFLTLGVPLSRTILYEIRIPRMITGVIAGMMLAVSGMVFQTILNNQLADQFSLGLASGASFGSALAVAIGLSSIGIALLGTVFSLVTLVIVLLAALYFRNKMITSWIILFGMFLNLFFSSLLYILILAYPNKTRHMMNYLFGSLNSADWNTVWILLPVMMIGFMLIMITQRSIALLAIGVEGAKSLGMKTEQVIYLNLIVTSVMTAVLISLTGIIGFVGLIVPQIVQSTVKGTYAVKLTVCAIIGVLFILTGDFIGRIMMPPVQIPVSVLMSIIGLPVLMYMMMKEQVTK